MTADFWDAGRNALEQLGDYFARFFIAAGEKALELTAVVVDWTLTLFGAQALGGAPDGATIPGFGDPVSAAAWRPYMHLHLPIGYLRVMDTWFPVRESVGAIAIVVAALTVSLIVRGTSRLIFKR